jgi:hypothetical protein
VSELVYLLIPDIGEPLIWAPGTDAITDGDGYSLVLAQSLAQFIEGAGARDRLVHFGFVLQFLHRLQRPADGFEKLNETWAGLQAASFRNAGALFAELTQALPRVPGAVDTRKLCALLRRPDQLVEVHALSRAATVPPLTPEAFDSHLARLLEGLSADDLRHWLRHGRGLGGGQLPPLELPARVPQTSGPFEEALKRKRLAGVAPFIDQMVSALTLPARRAQQSELPVGGYSSVTNRGHPDQILFSEFAVDELEFLRRFAENELLYWQREEPQSQVREDMIVLCDQGVRTWGDARLALTAAAIALGKRAEHRATPVRFAFTGNNGAPVSENLGALLESSDLTPNPGLALERVLEEPSHELRDVVLLTHPRSLLDDDVRAAARRAPTNVRLFALATDGEACELVELRHGQSISLRSFSLSKPRKPQRASTIEAAPDAPWTGPIEPVPFPFRFGLVGTVGHLAMDTDGRHLFTVCNNGLLHAWTLADERYELLPRPMDIGALLKDVLAVVGVRGGCAILCRQSGKALLVHYDATARKSALAALPEDWAMAPQRLDYLPSFHCVVIRPGIGVVRSHVVDMDGLRSTPRSREAAAQLARLGDMPLPPSMQLVSQPPDQLLMGANSGRPLVMENSAQNALLYQPRDGRLAALVGNESWKAWTPLSDGGALLRNAAVREAVCAGGTLAMRVFREGHEHVLLFRGPAWEFLGEFNSQIGVTGLAVSDDGGHVAFRNKPANVVAFKVAETVERVQAATPARHHTTLSVDVGDTWFTVYGGKFTHLVRWDRERLEIAFLQGQRDIAEFIKRKQDAASLNPLRVQVRPGVTAACKYDPARFERYGYSRTGLLFVTTNLGEIAVFGPGDALVAMFFVYRGTVAAWLPDGTRYGPAGITGGPTTPDALGKIGAALRKAGGA